GSALPRQFAESLITGPRSFRALQWERTWVMSALIGPTAIGLGTAFPLALQLAGGDDNTAAPRIGALYAVNTVCAVVGSLMTGFVLIPVLGLQATVSVAITLLAITVIAVSVFGHLTARARAATVLAATTVL